MAGICDVGCIRTDLTEPSRSAVGHIFESFAKSIARPNKWGYPLYYC